MASLWALFLTQDCVTTEGWFRTESTWNSPVISPFRSNDQVFHWCDVHTKGGGVLRVAISLPPFYSSTNFDFVINCVQQVLVDANVFAKVGDRRRTNCWRIGRNQVTLQDVVTYKMGNNLVSGNQCLGLPDRSDVLTSLQ